MKCCIFLSLIICLPSSLFAQGDFFQRLQNETGNQGRQIVEQALGPRFQNPQDRGNQDLPRSMNSLPSESGRSSGGNNQIYDPGDGGFLLPGSGRGQPDRPGNPNQPGGPMYGQPTRQIPGGSGSSGLTYSNQDLPGNPVMSSQYVVIRCPQSTKGSIRYTLSSNRGNFGFTMSAGQEQRFRVSTNWTIAYSDGAEQRRYRIEGGKTYTMKRKSDDRWQLYAAKSP